MDDDATTPAETRTLDDVAEQLIDFMHSRAYFVSFVHMAELCRDWKERRDELTHGWFPLHYQVRKRLLESGADYSDRHCIPVGVRQLSWRDVLHHCHPRCVGWAGMAYTEQVQLGIVKRKIAAMQRRCDMAEQAFAQGSYLTKSAALSALCELASIDSAKSLCGFYKMLRRVHRFCGRGHKIEKMLQHLKPVVTWMRAPTIQDPQMTFECMETSMRSFFECLEKCTRVELMDYHEFECLSPEYEMPDVRV